MYQLWYIHFMPVVQKPTLEPILIVVFYRSNHKKEPVRDWLKALPKVDRQTLGQDIKTVQFGYPIGMPLVRKLEPNLFEIRSQTTTGIARVIFTMVENYMILIHAFIKKSQKTPIPDLKLARKRLKALLEDR